MTQNEHNMVALFVSFLIYQFAWHMFLKHHSVTRKNMQEMLEFWKKNIFN